MFALSTILLFVTALNLHSDIHLAWAESMLWTVDDDGAADFHTIGEAINAAAEGDSVFVHNGIYREHLAVSKSITLIGESEENTIVDGLRQNRSIIELDGRNVVLTGFKVLNTSREAGTSYAGIKISGQGCNVTRNHIAKCKIGVFATSDNNQISENSFTNNGHGISLYSTSDVIVEANNLTLNTVGISLAFSNGNTIVNNSATNSASGGHGIVISSDSFNNTLIDNYLVENYHGMWLSSSPNNLIVKNTIATNELLGIELANSPSNAFYHNNIANNPTPVRLDNNSASLWDNGYPSGGNYWHNYLDIDEKKGPDQNQQGSDQIWDNPYIIDAENRDRYPSTSPYGDISDLLRVRANSGQDQTVNLGAIVHFDASQSTGDIASYEWNFGDGTMNTGVITTHNYSKVGTYYVTLIVKDSTGNSDTDQLTVTVVSEGQPPWTSILALTAGASITATLLWKYKTSKRRKKSLHAKRRKR